MSAASPEPPGPVAYLTGTYPKASHTFIQREIAALRDLGLGVETFSIRRPGPGDLIGPEEVAAEAETTYVLAEAKNPGNLLGAHFRLVKAAPGRWFKAVWLAMRTARPGLKGALKQGAYFLEAGMIADRMIARGLRHIHNHFADAGSTVAMLAGALADRPFSFTLHGPAELFEPESWHLGTKIKRAAFTVCISDFCRSQAMLFSDPGDWDRLKIVHCGVAPEQYDGPPPTPKQSLNLAFVGRLTQIKGLRVLMNAMALVREMRSDVTLTLVGDGEDRAWIEAEARRIGGVTLLGYQSQQGVAEALRAADALVLPSFAEGVPVVLMEAMASARPVIATRVAGVPELVEDGVSGFLVPPGNERALADAILALAEADIAAMGEAGRAKVKSEFSTVTEAEKLLEHFEAVLA